MDGLAGLVAVVGALRSGAAPSDAWSRGLGVRTRDGLPLLADLVARTDARTAHVVLAAARLSHRSGAPAAAVLEEVVAGLHREADEAAQRRSALAGPRATARLLGWLPALGLVLGLGLGADPLSVLVDGAGGTALLGAGLLASAAGHGWTRRILGRATRAAGLP